MLKKTTLKQKMILGSITAVLVPFIIAGVVIYIQLSRALLKTSKEMAVHVAEDISVSIEETLMQEIKLASAIAATPIVIEAAVTGDYRAAQRSLDAIHKRIGSERFTIFLLDRDGITRADALFQKQIGLDLSHRDYFQKAKTGQASVAGPLYSHGRATPGTPIFVVAVPILDEKEFLGIVGMPFISDFIAEITSKKRYGKSGYSYIINNEGLVLFHPREEYILKMRLLDQPGTENIRHILRGDKTGTASYLFEESERIAGFSPVKLTDWTVAFSRSKDEIMIPLNRILTAVSIGGFCFLFFTIVGIVIFSSRISNPVQKMMAMLKQVSHYSTEMILQIGLDRKIVHANTAFETISGQKASEIIHREPVLDNMGNVSPDTIWKSLEQGIPWSGRVILKEDKIKPVILDAMLLPIRDEKGAIQGYIEIGRDVSSELMFEKRLHQGQKLEAIGTLAGGIAHDFNNILSVIFGYAELAIIAKSLDSETKKSIDQIIKASERARDLVSQILTFSRQKVPELRPLKPKTVLKEALKLLRASIPATIDIRSQIESDATILAEPTQIHQLVMNLVTNAVHAIGDHTGSVCLDLEDFVIDEEFTRTYPDVVTGEYVLLRVSDTGVGMAPEIRDKVFEPFFTTKPQGEGTGLGLSMVHGIIKKMGGTISVYSEEGKGTTFSILIPRTETEQQAQPPENLVLKRGDARVAVIDDESDIVEILNAILSNLGYRVSTFTDSRAALDNIASNPDQFDIIISDYTMPKLTGVDIARFLKAADMDIPIILTSGYMRKEIKDAADKLGVLEFISKPINSHQLADAIHRILKDRRPRRPSYQ